MGKKKSSGVIYESEEQAFNDLTRLVEAWKKNRHSNGSLRRRYLDMLPVEFRSPRICDFILSNPDIFDIKREMRYMPFKSFSEIDLMNLIYKHPEIVNINIKGEYIFPYKNLTFPVRLAREIGRLVNNPDFGWMLLVPESDIIKISYFKEIPDFKEKLIKKLQEISNKCESNISARTVFKEYLVPFIKEEVALYKNKQLKNGAISPKDIAEASIANQIPTSAISQNMEGIKAVEINKENDGSNSRLPNQTMEAREDR